MKTDLAAALPQKPAVYIATISRALDGMFISLKLAKDVPEGRNAPRTIDLRFEYAEWFMAEGVEAHLVFIDETGYNIWTRRSLRRGRHGEPVRRGVHGQQGQNVKQYVRRIWGGGTRTPHNFIRDSSWD